jgi:prepilin-type N-terminal cleavage/methylation domain-containing protein
MITRNFNLKSQKAFTIVELLIVISIIGILSGILIAAINVPRQRAISTDSVRAANMAKLAQAVEAFFAGEGAILAKDTDGNPRNTPTTGNQMALPTYLSTWPTDATASYVYYTPTGAVMCLSIRTAVGQLAGTGETFKYMSPITSNCSGKVVRCPTAQDCTDASSVITYPTSPATSVCTALDGTVCN